MRLVAALCIVLTVTLVAGQSTGGTSTWLRDYLEKPRARPADYSETLEKKIICFRQASFCHVKCQTQTGDDPKKCDLESRNDYANLACTKCPEDMYSEEYGYYKPDQEYGLDMSSDISAKCYMHKVRNPPVPVADKPGVSLVGTFTGLCMLEDDDGDKCSFPLGCERVEVTVTGLVYQVDKALRVGPAYGGATGDIPNQCQKNQINPIREAPAAQAGIAAKPEYYHQPHPKPVVGVATIYSGPFTVHSHVHPLKYTRGAFQFSFFSNETTTEEPVDHLPKFGDETYKFEFIKDLPTY